MMNASTAIWIALAALFLGVTIPVLVQLRSTLKEMQERMKSTGDRVDQLLDDSQVVAHRMARMSAGLEGGEDSIRDLLSAVGDLSRVMNRMTSWMGIASSVGAAVGPAVASAVHAYRSPPGEEEEEERSDDGEAPSTAGRWAAMSESMKQQQEAAQQRSRA
jgi:uncharacterized protein YoxC